MIKVDDGEMLWHNDGHSISLRINKSDVEILEILCPTGRAGECHHERVGCVVKYFIGRFGLDCNFGLFRLRMKSSMPGWQQRLPNIRP
jgi:hypothetical protein